MNMTRFANIRILIVKIKKIKIEKFNYIENLEIDFSLYEKEFPKRKYNLNILIGENGTSKTTILHLIKNLFEKNEKNLIGITYLMI